MEPGSRPALQKGNPQTQSNGEAKSHLACGAKCPTGHGLSTTIAASAGQSERHKPREKHTVANCFSLGYYQRHHRHDDQHEHQHHEHLSHHHRRRDHQSPTRGPTANQHGDRQHPIIIRSSSPPSASASASASASSSSSSSSSPTYRHHRKHHHHRHDHHHRYNITIIILII